MWLAIIALADKVLGIILQISGWWIKRTDESQKKRDAAQADMDAAAKKGDFDAWKRARHDRNRA